MIDKLAPGTRVGPYEIRSLLGEGGMGEVYRAHDERLDRDVALKLMSAEASGDATRMRRMQQEARAAGQISHPNILGVFDVGTHDDRMYLVTELLEGESLREVVRRGPTPWRTALGLVVQVAEGLGAAHERGIVHRDIKPDNVFLTRDGRIKILDFGVATWRLPDAEGGISAMAATLSQEGMLVGTVGYMSPEQARGTSVDHRSDLFAFGSLFYELLSGREAFRGKTPMEILVAVQRDPPEPLHDLVPALPADVVRIVERCLEKDPARRFQSARDLLFALTLIPTSGTSLERSPAATGSTPEPAPPAPAVVEAREPRLRRRDALIAGAGVVTGAAAALAVRSILSVPPEAPAFRQVSYRRGTVYTARFTLDGTGVVYSATWDGKPRELFTTVPGTGDSRSLEQSETDVAHPLAGGEISVIRRSAPGFSPGVLARMSLAGGPPKDLVEGITWADGTPDGNLVLVVRDAGGKAVLELPPGRVLAEAPSISYPRLSPDRSHIAFLAHVAPNGVGDAGRLVVVDRSGKEVFTTGTWKSIEGVGWRSSQEVWFSASEQGRSLWMYAADLRGRQRLLLRVPGRLVLHDLFPDGRVVAERNALRSILLVGDGKGRDRDLSWQDFSRLAQLSRDGKQVLLYEEGDGAGARAVTYLRPVDGGAPVRIGEGFALALSPDGRQALLQPDEAAPDLDVVPVGAGHAVRLPRGPLRSVTWAAFVPGAARIVILGTEHGKTARLYAQELGGGTPRAFSKEGVDVRGDVLSPDGTLVAATLDGAATLIPVDGGAPRPLAGLGPGHRPVGWTEDGKSLFVRAPGVLPLRVLRYTLEGGKTEPFRTIEVADPAGVIGVGQISFARDGEVHAYAIYRLLSDLYVIENLR